MIGRPCITSEATLFLANYTIRTLSNPHSPVELSENAQQTDISRVAAIICISLALTERNKHCALSIGTMPDTKQIQQPH